MIDTFKFFAICVLTNAGKPLHYKEITCSAIMGGLETNSKSPEKIMYSIITNDIKKLGLNSSFIKISKGVFGLNSK